MIGVKGKMEQGVGRVVRTVNEQTVWLYHGKR